jgi:spore coat protein CotH
MNIISKIVIVVFILLCFTNCNKYKYCTSTGVEVIYPTGTEQYINSNSDYLFNQNELHTFELNIPEKALEYIDADPAAEEYIEGSLTFEGETISPVKIRYKGSVGAYWGSLSGEDLNNPSGYKTATKLSMRIKLHDEYQTGDFYGLKNLQFHSQNNDDSQMRERLAYLLFRYMGVTAPRSVHAKLIINGTYYGLYLLTEHIDEEFLSYNFSDAAGNLYKDVWPLEEEDKATSSIDFLANLETNINSSTSAEIIKSFADEIVQSDDSLSKEIIRDRMDIEKIISFIIVDRVIRNDDGAFMWRYLGNKYINHNYFWYETPSNRKVHLIPWDMDNTFIMKILSASEQLINDSINSSSQCKMFYKDDWAISESDFCDKLTRTWAMFEDEHINRLNYFLSEVFSKDSVDMLIYKWCQQIEQATEEAAKIHDDAPSIESWENEVEDLKENIEYARNQLQN